ncbi:hypothetical protein Cva_01464 [Caedimonas varicaedens]|uniref:MazG nucleotide pyrophosphohydrolase domain protein n=1 Tax=Caedimonas varicaedens TaxID=1629334 RepID=A0A0K8ME25_9PROT|nr:hypothetical protein Cva_01464 [Caedimonas varicaedens]
MQGFYLGKYKINEVVGIMIFHDSAAFARTEQKDLALSDTFKTMGLQIVKQMKKYSSRLCTKPWNYKTALRDLPCQVGSLTKLVMQLEGERYRHNKTNAEIKEEIGDELADILSLVVFIAHELNIDLNDAWEGMHKSDENKLSTRSSP